HQQPSVGATQNVGSMSAAKGDRVASRTEEPAALQNDPGRIVDAIVNAHDRPALARVDVAKVEVRSLCDAASGVAFDADDLRLLLRRRDRVTGNNTLDRVDA